MTMFDFLDTKAVAEPTVVDMSDVEEIEEEEVTAEESILESQEQETTKDSEGQEPTEPEEETTAKTAEELAESWDEGVFEYQGYHFEAVGVLPEGLEGKDLVAQTRSNTELHLSTYHTEDFPKYSYDEFYAVSNAPTADVFRCLETGRNYIPGENELFGYEGEFQPYLKPEAEKIVTEPHNFGFRIMTLEQAVRKQSIKQIWKPSICYRLWRKKNVWQHPKNRKSYPVMLAGVVSHRHLRRVTAAGRMSIWN